MKPTQLFFIVLVIVLVHAKSNKGKEQTVSYILKHANVEPEKKDKSTVVAPVLGYITPWNGKGYDFAKQYSSKLDIVSPVWFLIRISDPNNLQFTIIGDHDVDRPWIQEVKKSPITKIIPRFLFENWGRDQLVKFLQDTTKQNLLIAEIQTTIERFNFDGIILEGFLGMRMGEFETSLIEFYRNIASSLHSKAKLFGLVQPPIYDERRASFTSQDFMNLQSFVDFFSIMTYDYSSNEPGPNSPLSFVTKTILTLIPPEHRSNKTLTSKLLMGIPFYGWSYGPNKDAVTGDKFLQLIESNKVKIKWDEAAHEHYITYKLGGFDRIAYYPTLQFLEDRIRLAESLGVGIAIWELGQGLPYFFSML